MPRTPSEERVKLRRLVLAMPSNTKLERPLLPADRQDLKAFSQQYGLLLSIYGNTIEKAKLGPSFPTANEIDRTTYDQLLVNLKLTVQQRLDEQELVSKQLNRHNELKAKLQLTAEEQQELDKLAEVDHQHKAAKDKQDKEKEHADMVDKYPKQLTLLRSAFARSARRGAVYQTDLETTAKVAIAKREEIWPLIQQKLGIPQWAKIKIGEDQYGPTITFNMTDEQRDQWNKENPFNRPKIEFPGLEWQANEQAKPDDQAQHE